MENGRRSLQGPSLKDVTGKYTESGHSYTNDDWGTPIRNLCLLVTVGLLFSEFAIG